MCFDFFFQPDCQLLKEILIKKNYHKIKISLKIHVFMYFVTDFESFNKPIFQNEYTDVFMYQHNSLGMMRILKKKNLKYIKDSKGCYRLQKIYLEKYIWNVIFTTFIKSYEYILSSDYIAILTSIIQKKSFLFLVNFGSFRSPSP